MTDLTDLGVVEASAALQRREISSRELTEAVLARIHAVDGPHSHDGAPDAINAWVRVYEDDALAGADRADELLASQHDDLSSLVGIPIGLKDLYAVAGKPLTASSRVLADVAEQDCDVWHRLRTAGMVLIGHTHTHEFAAGGTTDQVGNPWDLSRSAGGSSGGSAAALAARMVPAATGSDTAGSLRIPSACCGTSTIKPTRGLVSLAGVVPLSWTLDHGGPMARSIADCRLLLAEMIGPDRGRPQSALNVPPDRSIGTHTLADARIAVSPRLGITELDPDVAQGLDEAIAACRRLGAIIVEPPAPAAGFEVADDFLRVLTTDMRAYHRRFAGREDRYRPALLEWIAPPADPVSGEEYAATQARRRALTGAWVDWFDEHRITAVIEPTIPMVAPGRGSGYEHAGTDVDMISFTHFWDWTGAPVVSLPAGCGPSSGLPVSISLIGRAGADWEMLDLGDELQAKLSLPEPPPLRH